MNYTNRALEKAKVNEHILHLSNEARGLKILPTIHMGHIASWKKGIHTVIVATLIENEKRIIVRSRV